jgi:uncharacterized membrane protein YeaQ/YmgE (transglycosylase-associated protein family)
MDTQSIIIFLLLGALAGWLAGMITEGGGLGLIGNIIVGILGSFIGYWLLPKIGVHINTGTSWLNYVITSAIGAIALLGVLNILFRSRNS